MWIWHWRGDDRFVVSSYPGMNQDSRFAQFKNGRANKDDEIKSQ
ncbi:hypothetical protein H1P_6970003 [Hyella patelloides LEGE 07179]|uniref:Uncharacterized protein n=1 Tax=Hyella patelloides LEGE 07179 TaxID=945734 RepID=A0A563W372_9CYAN|nr:hypothetical protein H1P_6970003 [Hyella patelloides LEGE 07179]